MKITTRGKRDYNSNWVQTASSVVALVFTVLVLTGLISAEKSAEAQTVIGQVLPAASIVIAGVIAFIGIFFKPKV